MVPSPGHAATAIALRSWNLTWHRRGGRSWNCSTNWRLCPTSNDNEDLTESAGRLTLFQRDVVLFCVAALMADDLKEKVGFLARFHRGCELHRLEVM